MTFKKKRKWFLEGYNVDLCHSKVLWNKLQYSQKKFLQSLCVNNISKPKGTKAYIEGKGFHKVPFWSMYAI